MWPAFVPVGIAEVCLAPRMRPRRGLASTLVLILGLLLLLSGCATISSSPRYRTPEKGKKTARERSATGRQEGKSKGVEEQEDRAKGRRKDGRKGGGLSVFRLFPHEESDLIRAAEKYLGCPYRFGGESPRGFDCSGLVCKVFEDAWNITLPRNSQDMSEVGMPVARHELQAGDLVFFYTTSRRRISHVGIYKGDGEFIHSGINRGVEVTSLDGSYWRRRLVCARRVSKDSISP